ncbi:hypothetical protein, partial [Saccharopolyspora sp. NPDC002686]|uniref:hypothetical protein n=1 Tax=Saccharopolyspora sp. NPDC002686 TaxID=3154541 RepID=UPI0033320B0E
MSWEHVVTWVAAGLAIVAVGVAGWQLVLARREAREAGKQAEAMRRLVTAAEGQAEKATKAAQNARAQSERAWEQVKLAQSQLEEAREERRTSTQTEQWEWAYAITTSARELVDSSQELIRTAMDGQVAPHYRVAADRHYRQTAQRWQETMVKAVARTSPPLETQQQIVRFVDVHQRLHGHLGVLLRAVETDTLSQGDALSRQVLGLRQEFNSVHRHLQRTISANLSKPDTAQANLPGGDTPTQANLPKPGAPTQANPPVPSTPTQQIAQRNDRAGSVPPGA